jgi:hypothetical protein
MQVASNQHKPINIMNKTNVEKVTDAMEFGSPLNQIVVLSAIEKYCEQIAALDDQPETWEKGCGALISWEAWKASAADVSRKLFSE